MFRSICKFYKSHSKVVKTVQQAVEGVQSGQLILVGGFGLCGIPMNLIEAVSKMPVKDLIVASNDGGAANADGSDSWGLDLWYQKGQVKRMISSFLGFNKNFQALYFSGKMQIQFTPQGTLAEKIRSGGAGIGGFYTKTGTDTLVQLGGIPQKFKPGTSQPEILSPRKQTKMIRGVKHVYEQTIFGDFSFVKAQKADHMGNLIFNKTARNFNEDMAKAAKIVVAQVQQIVQNGQLNPDQVHVPGVYVDRIFLSDPKNPWSEKKIQKLRFSNTKSAAPAKLSKAEQIKNRIMKRAALEVQDGANVNLGIGTPTLLPQFLPKGVHINIHAENGVIGVGPYPNQGDEQADLINAGKQTITVLPGASYFTSSQSFAIIRGGHLDVTMLGALQVSSTGDIANWMIPGKMAKGMGGAMDLVNSGSKVIVVMQHNAQKGTGKGRMKLVDQCWLPLTAKGKASKVITQKAVFTNIDGKLVLTEIAEGLTVEQLQQDTDFKLIVSKDLKTF